MKTLKDLEGIDVLYILKNEDVQFYGIYEPNMLWVEVVEKTKFDFAEFETIEKVNGKITRQYKTLKYKEKGAKDYMFKCFASEGVYADKNTLLSYILSQYKEVYCERQRTYWVYLENLTTNVCIEKQEKYVVKQFDLYKELTNYITISEGGVV